MIPLFDQPYLALLPECSRVQGLCKQPRPVHRPFKYFAGLCSPAYCHAPRLTRSIDPLTSTPAAKLPTQVQVLQFDASNIEAIACLGSYHFYSDQPEVSMMYLRRILQMGKQDIFVCGDTLLLLDARLLWC